MRVGHGAQFSFASSHNIPAFLHHLSSISYLRGGANPGGGPCPAGKPGGGKPPGGNPPGGKPGGPKAR
jgi:hypothetical protein